MNFDLSEEPSGGTPRGGTPRGGAKPRATAADALRHLIMGQRCDSRVGFKYGSVFRCLCEHFGRELGNDRWCDLRRGASWLQTLDGVLRAAGVPARTLSIRTHLRDRGAPVRIPRWTGVPSIGYLRGTEIVRALAALSRADLSDADGLAREYLADIRGWLDTCAAAKRDLVCFYD